MTPDNLSFIWAVFAFGLLMALLERFSRPAPETSETDRSVFDHADYQALLSHWNGQADELERQWDFERREPETIANCREHIARQNSHWGSE